MPGCFFTVLVQNRQTGKRHRGGWTDTQRDKKWMDKRKGAQHTTGQTEIKTGRQTRQITERQRDWWTDGQKNELTDTKMDSETDSETDRGMAGQMDRWKKE